MINTAGVNSPANFKRKGDYMFKVIDISKYQGNIDFNKVKDDGIKGVIIRLGYRGYGKAGNMVVDPWFKTFTNGCINAGLPYGFYLFSQATNRDEGIEEAKFVIELIKKYGYKPEFPIYIDTENSSGYPNGRADGISNADRTAAVKGFCGYVEQQNFYAGIYASTNWFNSKLDMSELTMYDLWCAHYATKCTCKYKYGMWQYTSSGSVKGINGRVDMNNCYNDYPIIIKKMKLNGFSDNITLYNVSISNVSKGDKDKFENLANELGVSCSVKEV